MARIFYLALLALWFSPLSGQNEDPSIVTMKKVYTLKLFEPVEFGPARWLDDGSGYTILEPSPAFPNKYDIVRYASKSGERKVLVSADHLILPEDQVPLEIKDYEWSSDGQQLLLFTNTRKVWREHTRGDYWVIDLDTWRMQKLGGDKPEATLMFAKFSPYGKRVGYVHNNNIYVENLASGQIIPLTTDGSETIINGTFDWVYEEEFRLRDGFRWSPDGQNIAYWQLDASGIRDYYLINNTDSLYPTLKPIQYPKVGTINSACRLGVVSSNGSQTTWLEISGDPRNNYLARMEWADNSDEVIVQQLNRKQNTNLVMLCDASTGKSRQIFVDQDSAWVEVVKDWKWLDKGRYFTWVSERDGWNHAYKVSRDGKDVQLVTPGPYDVVKVESIDDSNGWLYFIAAPENPTQRYLYRVPLDGSGKMERLSPRDQPGTHEYEISPDARWAIHTYSSFGKAPIVELVELPSHKVQQTIVTNQQLRRRLDPLRRGSEEFFRLDIGNGVQLDGWIMKPYDFNPMLKYPLLFYVYGEPANQTVLDEWEDRHRYLWYLSLTQQGYVVVSVDNRGTPAPRGRAWRKSIYGKIGILASQEQAAACRQIRQWPFVDSTRIAVWGWSGGGSMTLNLLFRYPDLYHTGISVAPVSYQRLYDTIYQERYMGLPSENEYGYREGSPITHVHGLRGNLMLIHGTGDDNVHYQSAELLVNELIKQNKQFSMMAYPNRSHSIEEGPNTRRHLYELMTRYLIEHMPPGPIGN